MTNDTSSRERYDLVPGITAFRLQRVMARTTTILSVLSAIALILIVLPLTRDDAAITPGFFVAVITIIVVQFGVIGFFAFALSRRSRAETVAGYTTRTAGFPELDQVDPTTGAVIRRAGSAVLTVPGHHDTSAPGVQLNVSSVDAVRFEDARGARRARAWVPVIAVVVALAAYFGIIFFATGGGSGGGAIVAIAAVSTVVFLAIVLGLTFWAVSASARGRERRVAAVRPTAFAFNTQRTPELAAALGSSGLGAGPRMPAKFVVTVGADGLELWDARHTAAPRVAVPWASVDHAHPGKLLVSNGRRSFAATTIHLFLTGEPSIDLPFPVMGAKGIAWAGAPYANTVLDAFRPYARVA